MIPAMKRTLVELFNLDPTITIDEKAAVFDILEKKNAAIYTDQTPLDRTLSREQVAQILGCSTKSVSNYAKRGIIRAICLGAKGERASNGYSEKSVREALRRMSGCEIDPENNVEVEVV